ncbi:phosphoglucosamine mutase [Aliarcobacter butzleri]|uniref:Phosphoglucosamine mutase n=2 Tax=Aliarcobacter butzleri TaxID=28197 RepID=GLMM_ALIB4|nr:phosphoglucosamine mutase [Aliarcobacter butzleri]A8EQZ2.1 RecName: Full=Phosphoglucosamine mutase [Aliarcobacter butzleri RM4018]MCP3649550.1 phosphoglucosamine mutase [Arcobacter sp. DNRA7]ABV66366.1 phosphoglucosamine mutase [Aliarcobacter butzleri RM4018]KLE07243.1 phosphoglucosamine mutase [Aliarcobacter butzleri L353]KLE10360.1 phosphoglucosamine mutase [Aliarcobacter butzleri L354]MCG3651588.1 phosphoglucosamine mutase [Aliarcobacter butzleri]
MKLFGTDGVRGKAGDFLDAITVLKLAKAAGIYFRKHSTTNKILVGKDTRRSGYMIENALVSGLTAVGYDVIQIGPMPTPAIAYLTESMRCDAGIMISASHNPFEDNGIKFFDNHGNKLNTTCEEEIENIFNDMDLMQSEQVTGRDIGSSKRIDDVIGRYIVAIKSSFPKNLTLKGLRIILDCANGAAYKVGPTILEELGADVITINNKPNGFNINENCGAMHPETVSNLVKEYRADIGLALDGDADRLVVIDEKGEIVDGDNLLGALSVYLKNENLLKGDACVATVMSNKALEDYLQKNKISLFRSNVGDKYVLEVMKEKGINFGGEQSGHIIFSDIAKTGDGLASALQVLALIIKSGKKASEILNPFSLYPQILHNMKVTEKIPLEQITGLEEVLKPIRQKGLRDLIRYSGTENKIRLLLEGKNKKDVEDAMQTLIAFFKKAL